MVCCHRLLEEGGRYLREAQPRITVLPGISREPVISPRTPESIQQYRDKLGVFLSSEPTSARIDQSYEASWVAYKTSYKP